MKKRRKHNKEDKPLSIPTENLTISKHANAESDGNHRQSSNSRSRSGNRMPLSTLFRRSASQNPSTKQESESLQGPVETDAMTPDFDPRTNPRTHLQRMTVREALVYNRKRGRSPNRRALKLEERLYHKGVKSKSTENLSVTSDIVDGIQKSWVQSDDDKINKTIVRAGGTLPRIKKKKVQLDACITFEEVQGEFNDKDSANSEINELPLDKRKYLINRDVNDCKVRTKSALSKSSDISPQRHSSINDDGGCGGLHGSSKNVPSNNIPPLRPLSQASQETIEPVAVERASTWKTRIFTSLPHINISKSSTLESMQNVGDIIDAQVHKHDIKEEKSISSVTKDNLSGRIKSISSNETVDNSENILSKDDVSRQLSSTSERSRSRRSSYVSPRRFSRSSRASTTSNRSVFSDAGVPSPGNSPATDHFDKGIQSSVSCISKDPFVKDMLTASTKPKYVRHFSKESRKSVSTVPEHIDKLMENKETNTDPELEMKFVTSATQTSLKDLPKQSASVGCNTDDIESVLVDNVMPETVVPTLTSALRKSNLKREVVVIQKGKPGRRIGRTSVDSAFKPITVDKARKLSETNIKHNEIEIIQEADIGKLDMHVKHMNKKQSKTNKGSRKVSSAKDRTRCSVIEDEVFEPENKETVKRKSMKSSKDFGNRTKSESRDESLNTSKRKSKKKNKDKLERKSRSLSRKRTEEPSKVKNRSLKLLGRSSSMNELFGSEEESLSIDKNKRGAAKHLQEDHLSRSLDSVNTQVDDSFQKSIIKLKCNKKTPPKLSLVSIVTLKSKIAKLKKRKDTEEENLETESHKNLGENDETPVNNAEVNNENNDQITVENDDLSIAKMYYENEVNTSIGKSLNSLAIVDSTDQEVKDYVFEKRIQFSTPYDETLSEEDMIKQRQRNTRLTERRESKVRLRQKKVISCCKKFIAFLFSHIGLCSLVVAYCILGGIIFKELEGAHEIEKKKEMTELRQNFTERIHRLAFETSLTKGSREKFKDEVNAILKNFSVIIHKQTKEAGWDGQEIETVGNSTTLEIQPEQWSYPSSLLYAITVMTTIGYGHVAPKTDEGRIMTIAYAVLGIPLTLLCLTNIGDVMAHGFRMLYGKVCCGVCCILFKPRRRRRQDAEKGILADRIIIEDEKSNEPVHVPTSVCLLLMTSYIMLGTILFSYWESWDYVTGTYFCFITLSTIGFGDVVPGMSQKEWNQHEKLVSCALYLVLGLSLIAMCFNLVQEDVKAKCRWLGMKLGIIDKPVSSV